MGALTTSIDPTLTGELLRRTDRRVALSDGLRTVTHEQLPALIEQRLDELRLGARSLVVVSMPNTIDAVITYLAVLAGGHVPLLAPDDPAVVDRLAAAWSPNAVVQHVASGPKVDHRRATTTELHPDLAVLLSTSGSTGSPKLVRLSHRNLLSNARSIIDYLALTSDDVGITTLPLSYSYGLSVLHSHLLAGASVAVTELSVVDPCFRALMVDHGVTNLAGVPHTYDLLDRVDLDGWWPRSLRMVTQAGGRMAPTAVVRWAERARRHGAELFVMYGQTEATARIAYLPPDLATRKPEAIGVPIPGGSLSLRPVDGAPAGVGELVYRGDNVMMGYAIKPDDLGRDAELDELATGDLARHHPDPGVFEIVGRRSRLVKPFGLRIDLDHVEHTLGTELQTAVAVTGDDERITIVAPGHDPALVGRIAQSITGLPIGRIHSVDAELPRTTSGKVDYAAIASASAEPTTLDHADDQGASDDAPRDLLAAVAAAFAAVSDGPTVTATDTFVSLGGDSLSYIECALRLERVLGDVPGDWHLRTIGELAAIAEPRRRTVRVDSTVVLRAVAICLVVSTHMRLWHLPGGAHTLIAIAGYNFARFIGSLDETGERFRAGLRTAARVAIPTAIWVAVGAAIFGAYGLGTQLLVNNYVGPRSHDGSHWHFWFIEVFVHLVVAATLLLAIPAVRRVERRHRYLFPLVLLAASLVLRMEWAYGDDWYNLRFRTHGVAWFFVLGWLIQASRSTWQRVATTVVCLLVVPGFFQIAQRDWRITIALIALVWVPAVRLPRPLVRPLGTLAAASMWIYISHFAVWPLLDEPLIREVAYLLTIVTGVAVWFVAGRVIDAVGSLQRPGRRRLSLPPGSLPT